jgi:FtsZ-binding cell division protein ZapB
MDNLTLDEQGAVLPGTPVFNSRSVSPKLYFPVVVTSVDDVCLAIIGQGLSFCLRRSCSVVSHQEARRFTFSEGPAILIRKAKDVAYCEPTLPYKQMADALLAHWKANPRTLDQWSEVFLAYRRCLESLPSSSNALITESMVATKREFHRQAQEVRTPAKVLFADKDSSGEEYEDVPSVPLLSPFKPSLDASTPGWVGRDKKMAKHVRLVEDSLSVATQNLIHQRGTLLDQDHILRGLEARLDCVQDHLGATPIGLSSEFEAPTLNGRVALLADKFSLFEGLRNPPEPQVTEFQVQKWVDKWLTTHDITTRLRGWDSFTSECETFLGSLVTTIQGQATEIAALAAQFASEIQASATRTMPQPADAFSRFSSLSQGLRGAAPFGVAAPTQADSLPPNLVASVQTLQLQVKELSTKLASVSLEKGNYCVRFGNAGFRNPRDVLPLIQAQMPTSYFGCFVNAAILLEWILGNSGEDTLKNMERMHKLKIPSLAEVHALKGLESSLPRLFGDIITFTGRQHTSYFTKVPSVCVWTNGSTGTKEFILTNLAMVVEAVRATIDQRLPAGKELHTLANLALESSSAFIMSMVSFIEENRESYALSNYPDAMQWSLNTRLSYRVWKEVYSPCSGLMEKVEPNDLQATASTVIYHVLLTIDIQESFRKVGIKNHSVVSSEYVKFLSTNTGYDSIAKLQTSMHKLEEQNKLMTVNVREASASAKTASTTCGELKKKVEAHEKRLQSIGRS